MKITYEWWSQMNSDMARMNITYEEGYSTYKYDYHSYLILVCVVPLFTLQHVASHICRSHMNGDHKWIVLWLVWISHMQSDTAHINTNIWIVRRQVATVWYSVLHCEWKVQHTWISHTNGDHNWIVIWLVWISHMKRDTAHINTTTIHIWYSCRSHNSSHCNMLHHTYEDHIWMVITNQ